MRLFESYGGIESSNCLMDTCDGAGGRSAADGILRVACLKGRFKGGSFDADSGQVTVMRLLPPGEWVPIGPVYKAILDIDMHIG